MKKKIVLGMEFFVFVFCVLPLMYVELLSVLFILLYCSKGGGGAAKKRRRRGVLCHSSSIFHSPPVLG